MGIVKGGAGTGTPDTVIQHAFKDKGFMLDDLLLPRVFLFE